MKHWSMDDVAWDRFDASKADPDIVPLVKAAAMVERNGLDYAVYLGRVFADDPDFKQASDYWAVEEVQHGDALGKWSTLADPGWDFEAAFERYRNGYKLPLEADASIRGSRSGELIARCMVETGTSSYYTALGDATDEPVLKAICRRIAADELRHYKTFYQYLNRYMEREELGKFSRLRIALGRINESEDDELAFAYYAANSPPAPYHRETYTRAYMRRAYAYYRPTHVDRGVAMIFKAVGLKPHTQLYRAATRMAWWYLDSKLKKLTKEAA